VSSSSSNTLDASAKVPAIATLCFCPPLRVWIGLCFGQRDFMN
jgi:hypothetical protein